MFLLVQDGANSFAPFQKEVYEGEIRVNGTSFFDDKTCVKNLVDKDWQEAMQSFWGSNHGVSNHHGLKLPVGNLLKLPVEYCRLRSFSISRVALLNA